MLGFYNIFFWAFKFSFFLKKKKFVFSQILECNILIHELLVFQLFDNIFSNWSFVVLDILHYLWYQFIEFIFILCLSICQKILGIFFETLQNNFKGQILQSTRLISQLNHHVNQFFETFFGTFKIKFIFKFLYCLFNMQLVNFI